MAQLVRNVDLRMPSRGRDDASKAAKVYGGTVAPQHTDIVNSYIYICMYVYVNIHAPKNIEIS